jgi:hypothetical protein
VRATTHNEKPHFIGTSASRANFLARVRCGKIYRRAFFLKIAPLSRSGGGGRHLHTKLSGVTVIFFLL